GTTLHLSLTDSDFAVRRSRRLCLAQPGFETAQVFLAFSICIGIHNSEPNVISDIKTVKTAADALYQA
ncbi:MAG TPA: hypothetical protein VN063_00920, partial [Methylophilaceae bacterium]|nr:hypothetical protein [Methylophilaceae bacterium]